MLASLISHESGDLSPQNEISTTCNRLRRQGKLHGIFVRCADNSMGSLFGISILKASRALLANGH